MNNGEANALNKLLHWILSTPTNYGRIDAQTAQECAAFLAGRAYKTLMAGLTEQDVSSATWPAAPGAEAAVDRVRRLINSDRWQSPEMVVYAAMIRAEINGYYAGPDASVGSAR